jgi:plastocyanin
MKKMLLLAMLIISSTMLFAKVIKIKVSNFQFTPKTVNAKIGDTVVWVWKEGIHFTSSTSVPPGAKTWNEFLGASNRTFVYRLKVAGIYQYNCKLDTAVGMVGIIRVTAALAADLNNFSISDEAAEALLTWKTGSSKDVAYFSVQRSTDGDNYTEIAKVNADISNSYRYTDKNNTTTSKYVYYQLEMVDLNGNRELSEIKMFTQKTAVNKLITSITPNPVSSPGDVMLQFNAGKEGSMLVQVFSQSGGFVKEVKMAAYKGLNNGQFHLGNLTPGSYYVVCTLEKIREKHTIIVK